MSRVSIIAVGSRGDVAPYTGVGGRLRDAGHEVTIAADKEFAGPIGDLGLGFRPLTIEVGAHFGNINDIRARYGLPPMTAAAVRKQQADQRWPVRYGYSPHVPPRPDEWRPGADVVGYWWPAVPPGWTRPPVIEDVLAAGPPPVFVGFGSSDPGDGRTADRLAAALRETLTDPGYRQRATEHAAAIATEDGTTGVVGAVDHLLRS